MRRARAAQQEWAKTSFDERRQLLRILSRCTLDHADAICRVSARDSGKPMLAQRVERSRGPPELKPWSWLPFTSLLPWAPLAGLFGLRAVPRALEERLRHLDPSCGTPGGGTPVAARGAAARPFQSRRYGTFNTCHTRATTPAPRPGWTPQWAS